MPGTICHMINHVHAPIDGVKMDSVELVMINRNFVLRSLHGDNGAGLGASHQTGWTGMIAVMLDTFGRLDANAILETERSRLMSRMVKEQIGGEQLIRK
jgi:hypothetical protein